MFYVCVCVCVTVQGLNDREGQGHWEWVGGEPVTFTNWRKTPPRSKMKESKKCVLVWRRAKWQTQDCKTSRGHRFVCSKKTWILVCWYRVVSAKTLSEVLKERGLIFEHLPKELFRFFDQNEHCENYCILICIYTHYVTLFTFDNFVYALFLLAI